MKILSQVTSAGWQVTSKGRAASLVTRHPSPVACRGFTMIEIAISLAVIGIALVGIIGVLPSGMNVQKENREETIINQDATILMEAIRNGARGVDDMTNYIYAITNYWTKYDDKGNASFGNDGYTFQNSKITKLGSSPPFFPITNGLRIIGILSTPEFTTYLPDLTPTNNVYGGGYSNHVVAFIRSMSGLAVEKPPQENDSIIREDSFSYRLICDNGTVQAGDPASTYGRQMDANLRELRLTFLWPQRPNGSVGRFRQTFRTLIAGQLAQTNVIGVPLYFFQSQSFTNAP
jgi:prepilin-type N-terminal cleavage/methylation domain-containing protein